MTVARSNASDLVSQIVLGIDLGTSGVKAVAVDRWATPIAYATVELPLHIPRPGWSEQDPEDWWTGTVMALRALAEHVPSLDTRVEAIALSGQMHGATFLDREGTVLRPAILWNDQRSSRECAVITDTVGFVSLVEQVGNRALAGFTAPKILWVRDHEPDVYRQIATVLLPKDYVNFRLSGRLASEPSDASGTLLFDVARRRWSEPVLSALGIPEAWMPPVLASDEVVGRLTPAAAHACGLLTGTPIVAGGADNACAALGTGIVSEADMLVSIGTSGTVLAASSQPRVDPEARLHTFCHVVPDQWYSMGVVLSAGAGLRWYRDTFFSDSSSGSITQVDSYELITGEAATSPVGSKGLIFLPYLSGERTPHPDPLARGVLFGLSLGHDRADVSRSVLEGITFALRDCVQLFHTLGIQPSRGRATGGGASSSLWVQMLADNFGLPIIQPRGDTGPAMGAALLAGSGVGFFTSMVETARSMDPDRAPVEPSTRSQKLYERPYDVYRALYPALSPIFSSLPEADS